MKVPRKHGPPSSSAPPHQMHAPAHFRQGAAQPPPAAIDQPLASHCFIRPQQQAVAASQGRGLNLLLQLSKVGHAPAADTARARTPLPAGTLWARRVCGNRLRMVSHRLGGIRSTGE